MCVLVCFEVGRLVWHFILERNGSLRKLRPPDIFAKIITMGVRMENKMRLGMLRY